MDYKDLTKDELITVIKTIITHHDVNSKIDLEIIDLITGNLTVVSDGEGKWYFFEGGKRV